MVSSYGQSERDAVWARYLDDFFVAATKDIARRTSVDSTTPHELSKLAGLLRQLLLDKPDLVVAVNHKSRLPLRFVARPIHSARRGARVESAAESPPTLRFHGECLDPMKQCAHKERSAALTLAEWVALPVIIRGDMSYTVADYISKMATRSGRVHFGTPRDELEDAILKLHQTTSDVDGGAGAQHALLRAIGRVTVAGLADLVSGVERR
jgi:hypothetical protein